MDQKTNITQEEFKWRRLFPWLHITSAFRISLDFSKILLAVTALLLLNLGNTLIDLLPFATDGESKLISAWSIGPILLWGNPANVIEQNLQVLVRPFHDLFHAVHILCLQQNLTWEQTAFATTKLFWSLIVWSLFGGAITRIAALQFARDEPYGMTRALQFAGSRFLSYFSAPLLPAAGFLFLALICMSARVIMWIPYLGELLVGVFWFLPLIFGVLMTLIFIGIVVGWPIMLPVISTEASDAFDGFSRSYSYLYNRIWVYSGLVITAALYGVLIVIVSTFFMNLVVQFSTRPALPVDGISAQASHHFETILNGELDHPWYHTIGGLTGSRRLMFILIDSWLHVLALLLVGFFVSYFWTAWTIIYFLLRRSDDGVELNQVYLSPDQEDQDELLPLVGVANSDQPIIERPVSEELDASNAQSK